MSIQFNAETVGNAQLPMEGLESIRKFVPIAIAMRRTGQPVGGRLPGDFPVFPGEVVELWYFNNNMNDCPEVAVWQIVVGDKLSARVQAGPAGPIEQDDITVADENTEKGDRNATPDEVKSLGQVLELAMRSLEEIDFYKKSK